MSKQPKQKRKRPGRPSYDTSRLVVWGERRKEPDWDSYIAALLSFALRKVEGKTDGPEDET